MVQEIIALERKELRELFRDMGEPEYRADQLFTWLHAKNSSDFLEMTDLPLALRTHLADRFPLSPLEPEARRAASDGTRKYSFRLSDGELIESVLLPEPGYISFCISSQVGCPLGCRFCATGTGGFRRNLTPGEILGQVSRLRAAAAPDGGKLGNILFMGMGEPLLNLPAVLRTISILTSPGENRLSPRRIIVSTAGILPELTALAEQTRVRIAVSLAGPGPEVRQRLVPRVEKKYPLPELLSTLKHLPRNYPGRLMIEYVLVPGVNDTERCAEELARRLGGIRARINLIPLNTFPGSEFPHPDPDRVAAFQHILRSRGRQVFVRQPRGDDIQAACGQLAGGRGTGNPAGATRRSRPGAPGRR